MKKEILFLAEELEINGAVTSLLALLKALPADKYEISLFLFLHGGNMMKQIPLHVKLLPECLPYAIHRMPRRLAYKRALKSFRFDLLLYRFVEAIRRAKGLDYNLWGFLPMVSGNYDMACCYNDGFVAPMMLRKVNAKKKCAWIHSRYSNWSQMPCVYEALHRVDMCVPVSIDTGKDLDNVLGTKLPKQIVHNITDAETCRIRANEVCEVPRNDGIFRIVSVGRVSYEKFFDIIPPTAHILDGRGIKYEWFIIGNGDKFEELLRQTKNEHLDDHVLFIGSRSNPMPWIKSADVFVNPSRFEAWGMTVSEALCLGKAVVVSDIPVFQEQIADGENGLIRKVTPENIADAIELLLKDDSYRHKLEQNAVKYPFTKEVVIKEFDDLVQKLGIKKNEDSFRN